ncbi:unnamed protein product, partial [Gadus morhua 'NCC']
MEGPAQRRRNKARSWALVCRDLLISTQTVEHGSHPIALQGEARAAKAAVTFGKGVRGPRPPIHLLAAITGRRERRRLGTRLANFLLQPAPFGSSPSLCLTLVEDSQSNSCNKESSLGRHPGFPHNELPM